ncbi:MAG: phosphoribosylanthranilate isomerase [Gammaproteobacteria bacterium]|nr:phosphoribosylanthranilate isomerase [Gammaproteobacteria bacterium]
MGLRAPRVRVKICGLTRPGDAIAAAQAGADAIGLVFYPASPRAVSVAIARAICAVLPPFVSRAALFVNESAQRVEQVLAEVPIDTLQFHGDETSEYCASFGVPFVKAIGVKAGVDVAEEMARFETASGILLDSHDRVRRGGTGRAFDWALIPGKQPAEQPRAQHPPIILAGGLNPVNVAAAVRTVQPYAVDVSGGVEREKGIKDAALIAAFMRGVNRVTAFQ